MWRELHQQQFVFNNMLSDNVQFDVNADFEDSNYKSCFARSVVVNSQYQQSKSSYPRQLQKEGNTEGIDTNKGAPSAGKLNLCSPPTPVVTAVRRDAFLTDSRRSVISTRDSRRSSACSSRIAEMPVENLLLKSQIETLQWQLKQTEASKEMYRAVMMQVVKFLERAHRSLQLLGSKLNTSQQTVPRSQSDYHMSRMMDGTLDGARSTTLAVDASADYTAFRDFTWRRQKKPQPSLEEIPPEKLSQEAFRLLRTAQSLLNTRAPDLAHLNNDTSEDLEFLEQLAKEFPRVLDNGTHRPDSRCSSLQLVTPEKDIRIATALNRKLSLQRNSTEFKRNSFPLELPKTIKPFDMSSSNSTANDECCLLSSTVIDDFNNDCRSSVNSYKSVTSERIKSRFKFEPEKSNSPPMSSVSSAEDESGFSSMNSFQELGIPLIHAASIEEKSAKDTLQDTDSVSKLSCAIPNGSSACPVLEGRLPKAKDLKLWQRPDSASPHKRWNSTPAEKPAVSDKQPLKVLWV